MATDWHLVLSRDGTVLGATDGAPASWVGTRLDDRDDVPEDLKDAGRTVLGSAQHSASPVAASVSLPSIPHAVHLTVIDALPLRRVPTDLRALLRSTLEVLQRQAKAFDVALNVVVDDQVPALVSLDADKIAWAITVLVGNALRYVRHGSQVMPGGSIAVRVTYNSAGPEVDDRGPGRWCRHSRRQAPLPVQCRARINRASDWGCRWFATSSPPTRGHIDVHSDTDAFRRGTTIRLTLPVS